MPFYTVKIIQILVEEPSSIHIRTRNKITEIKESQSNSRLHKDKSLKKMYADCVKSKYDLAETGYSKIIPKKVRQEKN